MISHKYRWGWARVNRDPGGANSCVQPSWGGAGLLGVSASALAAQSVGVRKSDLPDLTIKEVKIYVTDLKNIHKLNSTETGELISVVTSEAYGLRGALGPVASGTPFQNNLRPISCPCESRLTSSVNKFSFHSIFALFIVFLLWAVKETRIQPISRQYDYYAGILRCRSRDTPRALAVPRQRPPTRSESRNQP